MKIIREHINEKFTKVGDPIKDMGIGRPDRKDVIIDHYFDQVVDYLHTSIYPRIRDEEILYQFKEKLKDWFNKNV